MGKNALRRFSEAQKSKKVLLAEAAGIALSAALKKRIWEDENLIRIVNQASVPSSIVSMGQKVKEQTTVVADFYSGKTELLSEKLNSLSQAENWDEYRSLEALRTKLESMGGLAATAFVQVRGFKIGDHPKWHSRKSRSMAGVLRTVSATDELGNEIMIDQVEVDSVSDPNDNYGAERLSAVVGQLSNPAKDSLQTP